MDITASSADKAGAAGIPYTDSKKSRRYYCGHVYLMAEKMIVPTNSAKQWTPENLDRLGTLFCQACEYGFGLCSSFSYSGQLR